MENQVKVGTDGVALMGDPTLIPARPFGLFELAETLMRKGFSVQTVIDENERGGRLKVSKNGVEVGVDNVFWDYKFRVVGDRYEFKDRFLMVLGDVLPGDEAV